ncbi:hypothetical protein D0T12_32775 [Actinomadura spongiicola]|uniref:Uncharacterized protein n=1 Tax=Actinomadura spongiicola TaxID=2303421 RepID=A0A372G7R3_9ACTN|nr:hypothetical protein D0T12_32775 [Actinomadura spongiicola]
MWETALGATSLRKERWTWRPTWRAGASTRPTAASPFRIRETSPRSERRRHPRNYTFTTPYYDTLDLRRARRGLTLRRRTGCTDDGWHFKPTKARGGLDEGQQPAGAVGDPPPRELADR